LNPSRHTSAQTHTGFSSVAAPPLSSRALPLRCQHSCIGGQKSKRSRFSAFVSRRNRRDGYKSRHEWGTERVTCRSESPSYRSIVRLARTPSFVSKGREWCKSRRTRSTDGAASPDEEISYRNDTHMSAMAKHRSPSAFVSSCQVRRDRLAKLTRRSIATSFNSHRDRHRTRHET